MIGVYALVAGVLLAAGAVIGFVAVVSLGIHREEAARSMTIPTSDRIARGARAANGVYVRIPGVLQEASLHRQGGNTTSTPSTFGPAGTPGKHRRLQGDVSQDTVLAEKAA